MLRRAAAAAAALVFLTACSGGDSAEQRRAGLTDSAAEPAMSAPEIAPPAGGAAAVAPEQRAGDASGAPGGLPLPPLPDQPPAIPGDQVIKEGTMTLEVGEDGFEPAFQAVVREARALGGFVVSSTSRSLADDGQAGSVTVRVPVAGYEQLLTRVAGAGTVRTRDVTSQDVTGEVVDLESRLRHLQAQEAFYLELLGRAQDVSDAIAVQQQLDGVQSQVEQIKGRLQLLEDRTAFSTLTVEIHEPGTALPRADDTGGPSLARYWQTAQDAFVNVVGSLIVVVFFVAPLAIPAAAIGLVVWLVLRRRPASVGT
jgi:hypothetical protein